MRIIKDTNIEFREKEGEYMINGHIVPIYVTSEYWARGRKDLFFHWDKTEGELYKFLSRNETKLVMVAPSSVGIFRDKFIKPHLSEGGFVRETGIFETGLCGRKIRYSIIIDPNLTDTNNA